MLEGELSSKREQLWEVEGIIASLKMTIKELDTQAIYITAQVLEAQGEVATIADNAQGVGIQVGFKVFHQLLLQLDPNFNIKALEGFVTLKAVDAAIMEVEDEVATGHEGAVDEGTVGEEATQVATAKGTSGIASEDVGAEKVLEGEEAS